MLLSGDVESRACARTRSLLAENNLIRIRYSTPPLASAIEILAATEAATRF